MLRIVTPRALYRGRPTLLASDRRGRSPIGVGRVGKRPVRREAAYAPPKLHFSASSYALRVICSSFMGEPFLFDPSKR